jgi:bifunctional non-homologous end joining protein LigD
LRLDKKAREVVREREASLPTENAPAAAKPARRATAPGKAAAVTIEGVTLTNPDKPLFGEIGFTKRDLCEYYARIAPLMLPHVAMRPLSLVRCPNGWDKPCFFQKHAKDSVPAWVQRVEVQDSAGPADYMMANDARSLVTLAQMGVIEMHPWGSRKGKLEHPDRLIFDLDPDEKLGWNDVKAAALLVRTLLDDLGLRSFVKTTGGKGLHVVVPIAPTMAWDVAKGFCADVAGVLVRTFPDRFTAKLAKEARPGKILIDYYRNARGATAIAPYSVRARANAPVAAPIEWSALDGDVDLRFDYFNARGLDALLDRADPWRQIRTVKQRVTAAMRKRIAG